MEGKSDDAPADRLRALFAAILLSNGCTLLQRADSFASNESEVPPAVEGAASVQVSSAPAGTPAEGKDAAAMAAAMQRLVKTKTDYRLAPADLISVTVYQDVDMNRKVRINTDGTVSLPLIGTISVGGRTLNEAQAKIEEKFSNFLVNPQVSLFIEEYGNKTIFVMGEVQKPGSFALPTESRMTVLEAISTAGGFTPIAAQDRTRVLRNVNGTSVTYNIDIKDITQKGRKEKDMVLEPNDMIYVPQSAF